MKHHAEANSTPLKRGIAYGRRPALHQDDKRKTKARLIEELRDLREKLRAIESADVTAQKRAQEARGTLEEQIPKNHKLESLGILARGIAHDLNNLLVGILGNAELARSKLPHESSINEHLREIVESAGQAAELAAQMLRFSGRERAQSDAVDLRPVVEEISHLLKATVSKKVAVEFEFGKNVPPVRADAAQLRQVLMNLVTNSSEAIGDVDGVITVKTGAMECDQTYLSGTYVDDKLLGGVFSYFEVTDTGIGIKEQIRSKIFDPSFTTKFAGRGLGLPAVLSIARKLKGAIDVSSDPGEGTTIRVLFPAVGAPANRKEPDGDAGTPREGTVLVVDDEVPVRDVTKEMLEKLGLDVVTASNGQEAVEIFAADPERFDLILMDLTMPTMDGEECYRELRRIRSGVPVIISSGYEEQELIDRFSGKGLAGFIQKPFHLDYLSQKIKSVLGN